MALDEVRGRHAGRGLLRSKYATIVWSLEHIPLHSANKFFFVLFQNKMKLFEITASVWHYAKDPP